MNWYAVKYRAAKIIKQKKLGTEFEKHAAVAVGNSNTSLRTRQF